MDKDVQKIAGYQLSEPFLGWVKSTDVSRLGPLMDVKANSFPKPMVVLDPSVGVVRIISITSEALLI